MTAQILSPWKKSILILFHPLDCCDIIKREHREGKREAVWLPVLFYLMAFLVNYLYIFLAHFPLATRDPMEASLWMEAALVIVPLFSWVVCSYAMTSIKNGESTFREVFTASGYCLIPYIVLTPLLGVLSHVLALGEAALFDALRLAALLWVLALLFIVMKRMNDYGFLRTLWISLLSVIAVIVAWAVCLLAFSLSIQVIYFFAGLGEEIGFKLS